MIRRVTLCVLATYLFLCAIAGIALANLTTHIPQHPPRHSAEFHNWIASDFHTSVEDVSITAADNVALKAWYVQPPNGNGESVILLHGIGDTRSGIAGYSNIFLRQGYAVLLPDSRAHGESGGKLLTYGVLERDDVHRWATWLHQRDPHCMYLLGESMGAAIGLQAAAVSPQLCAVAVESPYATFRHVGYERMAWQTHLSPLFWKTLGRPIIEAAILYTRIRYGVYLPNADPLSAVQQSKVPTLLMPAPPITTSPWTTPSSWNAPAPRTAPSGSSPTPTTAAPPRSLPWSSASASSPGSSSTTPCPRLTSSPHRRAKSSDRDTRSSCGLHPVTQAHPLPSFGDTPRPHRVALYRSDSG